MIEDPVGVLRTVEGIDGIAVGLDATTEKIKVSGSALQTALADGLALKRDKTVALAISEVTNLQAELDSKGSVTLSNQTRG